jgi:hypothetical protein
MMYIGSTTSHHDSESNTSNTQCVYQNKCHQRHLVVELAVLVLAKQRRSNSWQSIVFKQLQPFLKSVIDVNFAAASNDGQASSAVTKVSD